MNSISFQDRLYLILCTSFCVLVIVSNLITVKLFQAPFFDNFALPTGLITYPLTFLISDLVTELYGTVKARFMVYLGLGMGILTHLLVVFAIFLPPYSSENQEAFLAVFGLNGFVIGGSLLAYLVAQILDIKVFAAIKEITHEKHLWLRNNISTLCSQIVDTFIVTTSLLYFGMHLDFAVVMKTILFAYAYKAVASISTTPLFYLGVYLAKKQTKILSTA